MELVDELEIWAPILADPLDWTPSSHTIPLPSQVEEYFDYVYNYAVEVDHFIEEPQHKPWGDQYLGGNMLILIPKENWRCGPRATRKMRIFPSSPPYIANGPSGTRGGRRQFRKNNDHWTEEEVIRLVEGVETYGVGSWTKVTSHYFPTSVREPPHLKDKWRNLLRACRPQKKMSRPLDSKLVQRIKKLATNWATRLKTKKTLRRTKTHMATN
ncbi:unnamed protein product [Alopecurus aequalis]